MIMRTVSKIELKNSLLLTDRPKAGLSERVIEPLMMDQKLGQDDKLS